MTTHSPKEIMRLLVAWGDGDESALADLTPLVYEELHHLAQHYMSGERHGHTLQTTALVNRRSAKGIAGCGAIGVSPAPGATANWP